MIQDYKDSHPDVDWDTHEMLFIRTRNGGWAIDSLYGDRKSVV